MALDESYSKNVAKRRFYSYIYAVIFLIATSSTTVLLSVGGYIPLDPIAAFIASLFAGFAYLLIQTTYVRFVVNSSQSARRKERQPDLQ